MANAEFGLLTAFLSVHGFNENEECNNAWVYFVFYEVFTVVTSISMQQDDVLRYITDELKTGTAVSTFRKERIASDGNGTTYW